VRFGREGADLVQELPITFSQAALGAEIEIPLVGDSTRVRIGAGTQSGHMLRLRGKGLPHLRGSGRGDMIVRVLVWTPTHLNADQERMFRQLAEVETAAPVDGSRNGDRGLWSKLKEAFGGG